MNGSSLSKIKKVTSKTIKPFLFRYSPRIKSLSGRAFTGFSENNDSEKLYLVGDIVDGWRLKRKWYWPQSHNDVVQKILRKAHKGTEIIYVPGNHDEGLRRYIGTHFGGIEVRPTDIYEAVNGDKYLVLHGDSFDNVMLYARWLAYVGDHAYDLVLRLNTVFNGLRRLMGLRYWSLSSYLKIKVKNAVQFISEFERVLANEAQKSRRPGRDLRPHPPCRNEAIWRHYLYE